MKLVIGFLAKVGFVLNLERGPRKVRAGKDDYRTYREDIGSSYTWLSGERGGGGGKRGGGEGAAIPSPKPCKPLSPGDKFASLTQIAGSSGCVRPTSVRLRADDGGSGRCPCLRV